MLKSIPARFRTALAAIALATAALSTSAGCAVQMEEPIDVAAAQIELDDSQDQDSEQFDSEREQIEDADDTIDPLDGLDTSSTNSKSAPTDLGDGHLDADDLVHPGTPVTH